MDLTGSVTTDRFRELSQLDHEMTQDIAALKQKLEHLRGLVPTIHRAVLEYRGLREQFDQLANDCKPVSTRSDSPVIEPTVLLGDDNADKPPYDKLANEADTLDDVIAKFEAELIVKEEKLQQIQEELSQLNEQRNVKREPRYVNFQNLDPNNKNDSATEDVLTTLANTQDLDHLAKLQGAKIEELLEKIHQLENCLNTVKKQKDELLRVNHEWDEQYRLLKEDKELIISNLTKQLQEIHITEVNVQNGSTDHSSTSAMHQHIMALNTEKEELARELAGMREQQEKTDGLWTSAKLLITQEREARAAADQQVKVTQERYHDIERQLMKEKEAQACLKQEIEKLVSSEERSCASLSSLSPNVKDQIEMLKQQIRVYADDFANERSDRERVQGDREVLKEKLKTCEGEIELLKDQIRVYHEDFTKEREEKERLQRQVRSSTVNIVQNDDPWIFVPPNEYSSSQRRQPMFERDERGNYRGKTNYSPREIQEYAYQQQLQARGRRPGHPVGLYHGCEADGVSDGQNALKCPRCARLFPVKDQRAFDEHVDKCTT